MILDPDKQAFFVFDVESIGLHGEGFAVAGGVFIGNTIQQGFIASCPLTACCPGKSEDFVWVRDNVPMLEITHRSPFTLRREFRKHWEHAKWDYPGILMAAECGWPVEANFLSACAADVCNSNKWEGPYPLVEISSIMLAAGMDPMATYDRLPSELPVHNPMADACQSARLLNIALRKLSEREVVA